MLSERIAVPFIDKTIIDISYARKILNDFDTSLGSSMKPVPIDGIIASKGLIIKTGTITKDKSIHGMLVFGSSDVDLWDEENQKNRTVFCNGKTIYIDELLLDQTLKNRYRFTLAHEYAHWVLHSKIVKKLAKEKKLLPYLTCKERNINVELIDQIEASCERQANYLAGAILMPYLPLKYYCQENSFNILDTEYLSEQVKLLSCKFSVSVKAMYVRLRQLGYIDNIKDLERS
ncbi:MAG: ImmA/IrrE family metallo-endopeptidase [Vulcanibacillus sp.]